jgi:hypothetical protein
MRIAKPLLLTTTPIGLIDGIYECYKLAGGLVFLMAAHRRKFQQTAPGCQHFLTRGIVGVSASKRAAIADPTGYIILRASRAPPMPGDAKT